ncbi:MAG TPA: hypothetical protein VFE36_06015 [Candidatus Baltobacteraceae bacterium]|jgi:hypothetical protein|nr:hypothetical protein [Candidatus Baltobacteraceae bacterium]
MKHGILDARARFLASRKWTDRERRIVWRGLMGRFSLAIEPLFGMIFMAFITLGIIWRAHHVASDATLIKIAWIFALGFVVFSAYFVAVLVAPFTAYLQTFKPIYTLDGYVRYRPPDEGSEIDACGYVAALFPDQTVACEWEWLGKKTLPELTLPAMLEFSVYAGVHKIDGKSTGLLPDEDLPLLAIGIATRHGHRADLP